MVRVNTKRTPRPAAGFTLIELLVVIAIIALLMGILLPSFSRARDLSRSTATQARITSLADACEMFKQENGAYPGMTRWPVVAAEPHLSQMLGPVFSGSQVMAMCLLDYHYTGGTPAWEPMSAYLSGTPSTSDDRPDRRFADLTDSALDYDPDNPGITQTGRANTVLDTFPDQMPILYFPARPGQAGLSNIYVAADNIDMGTGYPAKGTENDFHLFITRSPDNATTATNFAAPSVRPYRQDSFVIIAPGIDRQWFTDDDNRNFGK